MRCLRRAHHQRGRLRRPRHCARSETCTPEPADLQRKHCAKRHTIRTRLPRLLHTCHSGISWLYHSHAPSTSAASKWAATIWRTRGSVLAANGVLVVPSARVATVVAPRAYEQAQRQAPAHTPPRASMFVFASHAQLAELARCCLRVLREASKPRGCSIFELHSSAIIACIPKENGAGSWAGLNYSSSVTPCLARRRVSRKWQHSFHTFAGGCHRALWCTILQLVCWSVGVVHPTGCCTL